MQFVGESTFVFVSSYRYLLFIMYWIRFVREIRSGDPLFLYFSITRVQRRDFDVFYAIDILMTG